MDFVVTETRDWDRHDHVSFVTLEQFLAWCADQGDVIIKQRHDGWELEIYNDYRE